jgi:hypothetical protein
MKRDIKFSEDFESPVFNTKKPFEVKVILLQIKECQIFLSWCKVATNRIFW